jgi:nucleotide-binding universal stress UspA family protein
MLVTASNESSGTNYIEMKGAAARGEGSGKRLSGRWLNMINGQQTTNAMATALATKAIPEKTVLLDKILLATDFSPASDRALEYALSLARRYGSHLYVTHIVTLDGYSIIASDFASAREQKHFQEAKDAMAKLARSGLLTNVSHSIVIEEGLLWPAIQRLIKKYEVKLVVAGTRGMGSMQKILLGSNSEQMFRQLSVPMLTVGPTASSEPEYVAEFEHILFATDFGLGAEKEAAFALSLAQEHSSKLTVLHVWTGAQHLVALQRDSILRQMKDLVPDSQGEHCLVDYRVVYGKAVEEILRVREDTQAGLIVMGAKKRKNLAGHVPQTTAFEVVSAAPCPVLTVRS